ncbi:hypothetical protein EV356DRAFT_571468 [Viridothelium virens]|uniref:Uncharacterized protein n=1 Tax=Viridothelium virens TaxID=1048519 RepID=A0A6A6GUN7_VIRVR|nr:hypothetical protein EV356DRAFT_571468 [Viridothelium virens]
MSLSSTQDSGSISSSQNDHLSQPSSAAGLFPAVLSEHPPVIRPSMALPSLFGGPCLHEDENRHSRHWSCCYAVGDDGQLSIGETAPKLDAIKHIGESHQQMMTRLKPYSLSACRLNVTSSNKLTKLSGVWIKGATRDVILTVSHFKRDDNPKILASAGNTKAEVVTTACGDWVATPPVECELFYDYKDPGGERDFAIFVPCTSKSARSPAQSIPIGTLFADAKVSSDIVLSIGYNTLPTAAEKDHPNANVQNCRCISCWYASGNAISQKFSCSIDAPTEQILTPGCRSISVGKWVQAQDQQRACHTVTGWYGISGAGMYTPDEQGNIRLVALYQCGIFNGSDCDKNGAVTITADVLRCLHEVDVMDL